MNRLAIGLCLAPNLGGIGAALVETAGQGRELKARLALHRHSSLPKELVELLVRAASGTADGRSLGAAHRALGEAFAAAALRLADQAQLRLTQILCVGFEALTIHHEGEGPAPARLELGAPACVAERTGLTTATGFAWRDLAAGGHGAPLAPLPDFLLLHDPERPRAVVHLDAVSVLSWLPAGDDDRTARGAVAGPGSAFLDSLMAQLTGGRERSDSTGHFAVQGRCIPELLERWRKHPFLLRRWPKSAERGVFAEELARQTLSLAQQKQWDARDLVCTANHWIAESLGLAFAQLCGKHGPPAEAILCGTGARNGLLFRLLEESMPNCALRRADDFGVPAEAMPAMRQALLAALLLDQEPANLPAATGAAGARLLGQLTPGAPQNWSACLAWMAGQPLPAQEDAE